MGKIIEREIVAHDDGLNITFFLTGPDPKPDILIDDTKHIIYECFGTNTFGEKMYWRRGMKYA